MGQKVGGYRRNVPYGRETLRLAYPNQNKGGNQGMGERKPWRFEVNPDGYAGWNRGTSGTTEKTYGSTLSLGRNLRKEVEEVRKTFGGESNGLGRKGSPRTGYMVYGEYTYGDGRAEPTPVNPTNRTQDGVDPEATGAPVVEKKGKKGKKKRTKAYTETEFQVARARVARKYERRSGGKVERKRQNLKERRKKKGLEAEKQERSRVLGASTKRTKLGERCEAVTLSGILPTGERRTKLIVRELEQGLNHMEVRRSVETLRTHHAKSSQHGRKLVGTQGGETQALTGYYGYKVRVKGPLGGARRTMTYVIRNGTVPRGTKKARRRESFEHAKTKIGTIGVKVTYTYGLG